MSFLNTYKILFEISFKKAFVAYKPYLNAYKQNKQVIPCDLFRSV